MTSTQHTSIAWLPAIAGAALCTGAVGLLCGDAFSSGHVTINHGLQPLLVLGTVAAAVLAHCAGWRRPISAALFVLLSLLGSLATIYGTLGRQADARDHKIADAVASNRQLSIVSEALATAKGDAARECKSGFGARCTSASARVDKLTADMAGQRTASPDARADAIADLTYLLASADKARVRAIVAAIDPLVLPLFLEVGSILFFAVAFPRKRAATVSIAEHCTATVVQPFTREQALHDLGQLRQAGSGRYLAQRWGVDPSTASRWLQSFEASGAIARKRDGRTKVAELAGPANRSRVLTYRSGPAFR